MVEWKNKFSDMALERGKETFLNQRVQELKRDGDVYTAAVLVRDRFEVSATVGDTKITRMSCRCPVAKATTGKCEHVAAMLYAIENHEEAEKARIDDSEMLMKLRKLDEQQKQEEEKKQAAQRRKKLLAKRKKEIEAEERERIEEEKLRKEAEEKRRKKEEEKQKEEEQRKAEEAQARRIAREERKAQQAKKREEQKLKAAKARQQEQERQLALEKKRQEARLAKEQEARRREEKRKLEEAARLLAEKKRLEEEKKRLEEEKKRLLEENQSREEEAKRLQKQKKLLEERKKRKEMVDRLLDEKMRKDEEEAARRQEEIRRKMEHRRIVFKEKDKADYELLGESWDVADEDNQEGIVELEKYRYYDGQAIRQSSELSYDLLSEGRALLRQGKFRFDSVYSGYNQYSGEVCGQVNGIGREGRQEFQVKLVFSRDTLLRSECACPTCRKKYMWNVRLSKCAYTAAAVVALEEYLKTHYLGDATDAGGLALLNSYYEDRANRLTAAQNVGRQSLTLMPRLLRQGGRLKLSFRVGEKKLFVVKDLEAFCSHIKEGSTETYGSSTQINHRLDNFTPEGKDWIKFINQIVQEEQRFEQRLLESRSYYASRQGGVGNTLELFGWRLDEFFKHLKEQPVEYEDRDADTKHKGKIRCGHGNPRITMRITANENGGQGEFHGIQVEGEFPQLYAGAQTAYFIEDDKLICVDADFLEKVEPLRNMVKDSSYSFVIGRRNMSEFYHRILPQFEDCIDVIETAPDIFRNYLTPEARFIFYLDVDGQDVTCRIQAKYASKEVSVLDAIVDIETVEQDIIRDAQKEQEVLYHASKWFPEYDPENDELRSCGEEQMYQVMETGVNELMALGEVRCTARFRNSQKFGRVKVSMGVSVAGSMLDLDISTDDVSQEELLDILQSYRTRKKYYRLKDGSFVNLEDQSLEMLAELMDTMHLKPKDFIKGKMQIPVYRTLYLDRMLEENSDIYSHRDNYFREIVKGFKTVNDADFEEPASLSRIMRAYQKNGYKWMRTVESWKFGGILADDMGLGKTLQMIAVLLAAKEEGREGVSLVVTPASLVFNWGTEFEQFAPELKVSLITGNQEERREKIEEYLQYDVLVTSYDLLKRDIAYYEDKQFQYEVIDEAQYIKNHTTAAAKAVKVINSQIRFALTGTPIENRLSELWSIFDYLMPGFLYSYEVFRRELEIPIVKNNDEEAMKRLQKMVAPFILRRLKTDVLKDLPEKMEEVRYVRFGDKQQKLYDGQVVYIRKQIASKSADDFNKSKMQILAELTKLRQICCDPSLCYENYKGEAAKVEACLMLIQSAIDGGHRMLLFSQFTSMLEILQQQLDKAGISYYTITGATPKEKRVTLVKEFNKGTTPVFLISLKAGGVGLNLTGADMVIHYDPWWNQAAQNQATDRAHRIGQTKKVAVFKLIAKGSVEEKILKLQEMKKDLADQVIGTGMAQGASFNREELLELLQ